MAEDNARDMKRLRKIRGAKAALQDCIVGSEVYTMSPTKKAALKNAMDILETEAQSIEGSWN